MHANMVIIYISLVIEEMITAFVYITDEYAHFGFY